MRYEAFWKGNLPYNSSGTVCGADTLDMLVGKLGVAFKPGKCTSYKLKKCSSYHLSRHVGTAREQHSSHPMESHAAQTPQLPPSSATKCLGCPVAA
eukprot:2171626-Rhodomonas_salina.2